MGDQVAWEQEWTGPLDIVAGAAGPIILTARGVTAIDPADGPTRRDATVDSYTGPAGHSSFLLADELEAINDDRWGICMDAVVIPETDPTARTTLPAMYLDPETRRPVMVDGWSVTFTDGVPASRPLGPDGLQTGAWQVQAIDLDAVFEPATGVVLRAGSHHALRAVAGRRLRSGGHACAAGARDLGAPLVRPVHDDTPRPGRGGA